MIHNEEENISNKGIVIKQVIEPELKIYAFDFINGAGAIVVTPEDIKELESKPDLRKWIIYYMAGYCAFWQMKNCDWLYEAVDAILNGEISNSGFRTAKYICDKLIEDINSGKEVDKFPKFYLFKNSE